MNRLTAAACVLAPLILAAGAAVAKPARWTAKVEAGTEYDSNIHRIEIPEGESYQAPGAPLIRAGGELTASWQRKRGERLRFVGLGLAKLFASGEGQSENVVVVAGDGQYEWAVTKRNAVLGLRGTYYDALAYDLGVGNTTNLGRNFSMANGEASITMVHPKGHRLILSAGYRRFVYKPDVDFDWHGDHYGMRFETTAWRGNPDKDLDASSLDIAVSYRAGRRNYTGIAFFNSCAENMDPDPSCFSPTDFNRADLNHHAAFDLAYNTGSTIWSARYELQINDSNSFGQAFVRQRVELGLTAELTKRWSLTASVALLFNTFLDPLLLARDVASQTFLTIDAENRNSLALLVNRKIDKNWSFEARYNLFTNEFATQELRFRRQLFYSGLAYAYD